MGRFNGLDFWIGVDGAKRYRERKRRRTRVPLDVAGEARGYLAAAVALYILGAGTGALTRSSHLGLQALAIVVVALLVWVGVRAIAYLRLPIDEELRDPEARRRA